MGYPLPQISVRVDGDSVEDSARMSLDFRSETDATVAATLEFLTKVRSIRIDVGAGIDAGKLGKLSLVAQWARYAERVEVVGASARAVEDAKSLLLATWTIAQ